MNEPTPELTNTIEIDAECATVWEAIVNGELASEWMGDDIVIDPRPGGRVHRGDDDMIGTVEEVTDDGDELRIIWSWRHSDGLPSQVEVVVEPTESGSRVTVVERLIEYRIIVAPIIEMRSPPSFEMSLAA